MAQPKEVKSQTKSIERSWSYPAPLSGTMAKSAQQPIAESLKVGGKQGEQESIS
jgi:hypothetical protein